MSQFFTQYHLWVTPLSPLHLGTDEEYTPTNYVIDNGLLYAFSPEALAHLPEKARKELDRLTCGHVNRDTLQRIQALFYDHRAHLIPHAARCIPVPQAVEEHYKDRIGKTANREQNGKTVINQLEIERTAWDAFTGHPILPGSGLKGALRTAILNHFNTYDQLPKDIQGNRNPNQPLQEEILGGKFQSDPLRLLHIADAHPVDDAMTTVRFAVNLSKNPDPDKQTQAQTNNLYQRLEVIAPMQPQAFHATLNLHNARDYGDLFKRVIDLETLQKACTEFYVPKLIPELRNSRISQTWRNQIGQLLEVFQRASNILLLRLGRHSGAECVTLDNLRQIRIMRGKANPVWLDHATTLRLASDRPTGTPEPIPFGWVLVQITPDDKPPAWPDELSSLLEQDRKARKELLSRHQAEQHQMQARSPKAATDLEQMKAEQARRAAMSEEELLIQRLDAALENARRFNNYKPGGDLDQYRQTLLNTALNWQDPQLRTRAAHLLDETIRFRKWPKRSAKQAMEKLAQLKGNAR